ncbi:hypothetical protein V9L05_08615 [Bernardetia sp. Wsw4-3y2]|uniref:hypothetical protein n=1 Tax=Bernardetia sp. Wsw4-3y2 TaxID=3127471 RepID=UPI0030CB6544
MEQTLGQKFVKYTLTGSLGVLTLLLTGKELSKSLKKAKAKGLKLSTDKHVRWASRLYTALHNTNFLGFPDEDEEGIYAIAIEMCENDFEIVSKAYLRTFEEDLFTQLTSKLSSSEYNIFLNKLAIC